MKKNRIPLKKKNAKKCHLVKIPEMKLELLKCKERIDRQNGCTLRLDSVQGFALHVQGTSKNIFIGYL